MRFPITLLKEVGALITPQHKAILAIKAGHFIIQTIKNKRKNMNIIMQEEQSQCLSCQKFTPDNDFTNCLAARRLAKNCADFGIVTLVKECPNYSAIPS